MDKISLIINGNITLKPDGAAFGYPQTDGEGSGATDENVMYREVLPSRYTLKYRFDFPNEATAQKIMQARGMESCTVNYYDILTLSRVTKTMYPAGDDLVVHALLNNEYTFEPYELRFIQMIPNGKG
jgi:hypothetical protein